MSNQDLNTSQALKQEIVQTIAFFDLFARPLTAFEIWQFISIKTKLSNLTKVLDAGIEQLVRKDAFYFIQGREELVEKIPQQQDLVYQKFQIAKRAASILRFINGVKMVAVCNNFYYSKNSDVDVFIVLQAKRMWLSRFLVTAILQIFGLRRHGNKTKDRICLSFYITGEHLNLRSIALKPVDPYFYFWLAYLFPIYDDGVYDEFIKSNTWLKAKLPNLIVQRPSRQKQVFDNHFSLIIKKINGLLFNSGLGNFLEKNIRKLQLKKMAKNKNSLAKQDDSRVIVSDLVLKFHENDRRGEIIHKLKNFQND